MLKIEFKKYPLFEHFSFLAKNLPRKKALGVKNAQEIKVKCKMGKKGNIHELNSVWKIGYMFWK